MLVGYKKVRPLQEPLQCRLECLGSTSTSDVLYVAMQHMHSMAVIFHVAFWDLSALMKGIFGLLTRRQQGTMTSEYVSFVFLKPNCLHSPNSRRFFTVVLHSSDVNGAAILSSQCAAVTGIHAMTLSALHLQFSCPVRNH